MPGVQIDPTLPLQVTVDFQSRFRAAFRLFTRGPKETDPWIFLKEGIQDATAISIPLPRGSLVKSEFIFFEQPEPFRALLIFRQNGQSLPGGIIAVTAPGNASFVTDTVELE
jgi:hypothetical protein